MNNKLLFVAIFLLFQLLNAAPPLLLISIDGMRTDYIWKAQQYGIKIPNIQQLISEGVVAEGAYAIFPSMTFASHTSMITGVKPAIHGIYSNSPLDIKNDDDDENYFYQDIEVPTVFELARQANLSVVGVDWPVTVGAPFECIYPGNDDDPEDMDEAKFLYDSMKGPYQNVFTSWEQMFNVSDQQRGQLLRDFLGQDCVQNESFFAALHFNQLDAQEHKFGYMSPKAIKQLEAIDVEIGLILQQLNETGLLDDITIIVTSDHGFVNTTGVVFKPGVILNSLGLTGGHGREWIAFPICSSGNCAIYINPEAPENSTDLVDEAVNMMTKDSRFNITRVYNTTEIVELEAWKGSYVILELGFNQQMDDSVSEEVLSTGGELGVHGYDPTLPEMFASFVIKGPHIQVGKIIGMIDLIDIAPTVAYILGFEMDHVEGRILTEVFMNSTLSK